MGVTCSYKGAAAKLRIKKSVHQKFCFDTSMYGVTRANACSFLLAFTYMFSMLISKSSFFIGKYFQQIFILQIFNENGSNINSSIFFTTQYQMPLIRI